jgi:hypothetical protein
MNVRGWNVETMERARLALRKAGMQSHPTTKDGERDGTPIFYFEDVRTARKAMTVLHAARLSAEVLVAVPANPPRRRVRR